MDYAPASTLAPGVVVKNVPVIWMPVQVFLIRPLDKPVDEANVVEESEATNPAAFKGPDGVESVIAAGKRRPVLVIASRGELAAVAPDASVRAIPIYRRKDNSYFDRNWEAIRRGDQHHHLISMPPHSGFDFEEGVLDLTQAQPVKGAHLRRVGFRLTERSFGEVIQRLIALHAAALAP